MTATSNDSEILNLLKNLEQRISKIESNFDQLSQSERKDQSNEQTTVLKAKPVRNEDDEEKLEFKIGQFWLAKIGIVAFTCGIIFLLVIPLEDITGFYPSIIGLTVAIILIGLSWYWRDSQSYISEYLLTSGLITSFFSLLRLHLFTSESIIENSIIEFSLLLIVSIATVILGVNKKSFSLILLGLIFGSAAAMISDSEFIIFPILILIASITVFLKTKFNWQGLLIAGIILTYFIHLFWYLNNPFIGKQLFISEGNEYSLLFAFVYLFIFAQGNLIGSKVLKEDFFISFISLLNCIIFSGVSVFILFTSSNNPIYYLIASVLLISIAVIYWVKDESKYSTFYYSMFGFILLSAAVLVYAPSPDYYIWLGWQSLIVISTAVWFRSKFIIVANFAIFILILISYLIAQNEFGILLISFGIIALLSARILNWQKTRLELTTEQMRNAYLFVALLIIPFSLYQAIPTVFVTFSWIGVAIIYYALSLILKIKKYRWMALLTLLLTVGYIFILGFTSENSTYKILSFLSVGIVLFVTSIIYSRKKLKI